VFEVVGAGPDLDSVAERLATAPAGWFPCACLDAEVLTGAAGADVTGAVGDAATAGGLEVMVGATGFVDAVVGGAFGVAVFFFVGTGLAPGSLHEIVTPLAFTQCVLTNAPAGDESHMNPETTPTISNGPAAAAISWTRATARRRWRWVDMPALSPNPMTGDIDEASETDGDQ
jgi:hypothetical protein